MDPSPRGGVEIERVVARDDVEVVVEDRDQPGDDLKRADQQQERGGEDDARRSPSPTAHGDEIAGATRDSFGWGSKQRDSRAAGTPPRTAPHVVGRSRRVARIGANAGADAGLTGRALARTLAAASGDPNPTARGSDRFWDTTQAVPTTTSPRHGPAVTCRCAPSPRARSTGRCDSPWARPSVTLPDAAPHRRAWAPADGRHARASADGTRRSAIKTKASCAPLRFAAGDTQPDDPRLALPAQSCSAVSRRG